MEGVGRAGSGVAHSRASSGSQSLAGSNTSPSAHNQDAIGVLQLQAVDIPLTDLTRRPLLQSSGDSSRTLQHLPWTHPARGAYRYCIMVLCCLFATGGYMAFDSVGALGPYLQEQMGLNQSNIGLLLAVYSLPNLVLAYFGGIMVDRFGYNKAVLLLCITVTVGMILMAASHSFSLMVAGRVVVGIGSESLQVAQTSMLTYWFQGKELALSLSVSLTFGRLGSVLAYWLLPWVAADDPEGAHLAMALVAVVCALCVGVASAAVIMDKHGRRLLRQAPCGVLKSGVNGKTEEELVRSEMQMSGTSGGGGGGWCMWLPRQIATEAFVALVIICMFFYGGALSFVSFSTDLLYDKWDYARADAARMTSIVYLSSMLLSPPLGWFADAYGQRVWMLCLGAALLIPTFVLFAASHWSPVVLLLMLGLSFSMVPAALWPCVPLVVQEQQVGRAFGLLFCMYNASTFFSPLVFGYLYEATGEWTVGTLLFAGYSLLALLMCLWLRVLDRVYHHQALQQPSPDAYVPKCLPRKRLE